MGGISLTDILVTPLRQIEVAGGDVMHAIKESDAGYERFGEAYFSWVSSGAIKAWKRHTRMTMNLLVPVGQVRFVFYGIDSAGGKEYRVEDIGVDRYMRITVPPGIWFGFCGLYETKSLVLNIASIEHDPNEVERLDMAEIKYEWS